MVCLSLAFNHHVIDVGIHSFTNNWLEHLGDHPLICSSDIFYLVAEYAVKGDENSVFLIGIVHDYLVVT